MSNKMVMSYKEAMAFIDLAIANDQKDIAIEILKDLLKQAVEWGEARVEKID